LTNKVILMKDIFLVIETGYEGIEQLCWLTDSPKEAIKKLKFFRRKEWKKRKRIYKGRPKILQPKRRYVWDFFCIQKWDGKEFKCVCSELGVSPSEPMFR